MNSVDRLYKLMEQGRISVKEFEEFQSRTQAQKIIREHVQEQQPAQTKERITAGRKNIIGRLEQRLMSGRITTEEYKKKKAEYVDTLFELYIKDIITYDELKEWYAKSGLPLKKFFNTSGLLYKEMQLKDKLVTMNEEEMLKLLATNGMLVKRPLLIGDGVVLAGFKAEKWAEALQK